MLFLFLKYVSAEITHCKIVPVKMQRDRWGYEMSMSLCMQKILHILRTGVSVRGGLSINNTAWFKLCSSKMKKLVQRFEIGFIFQSGTTWVSYMLSLTLSVFLLQNELLVVFLECNAVLVLTFGNWIVLHSGFQGSIEALKVAFCK